MSSLLRYKDRIFYGWVVVTSFLIITIILYGLYSSFGFFLKSIADEYNLTRAVTSAIVSVEIFLAGFAALGAGWALDKYGPKKVTLFMGVFAGLSLLLTSQTNAAWQIFITYSVLFSIGAGAVFVVPTSVVCRWFDKKRGLALGIAGSASGLGVIMIAPVSAFLISSYDWRIAYIVLGLVSWAIIIPFSVLLKRDPREVGALPDNAKADSKSVEEGTENIYPTGNTYKYPLLNVFKTRSFWSIMTLNMFLGSCIFMIFTHLVPYITDSGFTSGEAAGVYSMMGVTSIVGRVLTGIASDKIGRKPTTMLSLLLIAGAMLWLAWASELWAFYLFAAVYGFANGGIATCTGALVGDVFGLARIGSIFGMLEIGFGIGAAAGPFIAGMIFDATGAYTATFLLEAVLLFIAALMLLMVRRENIAGSNWKLA